MKEKFDISKFNARLASLIIIIAGLGIAAIFLENVQWLATSHYGFYEFVSIFAGLALFVLPFLFVGWVFSWVAGRRRKDVEHTRLPIGKGAAAIVLFFAFFLALNFQSGKVTTTTVLGFDDLIMYKTGGQYYVQFAGPGKTADDEIISLEVTSDEFAEIQHAKDKLAIQYSYYLKLPTEYKFECTVSGDTIDLSN